MRQNNDKAYADVLNALRIGNIEGCAALDARLQNCGKSPSEVAGLLTDLIDQGKKPVCLLAKCDMVQAVNVAMLTKSNIKPEYIYAKDVSSHRKTGKNRTPPKEDASADEILSFVRKNTEQKANKTGGLDEVLVLGLGARVMLKKNLDMEAGHYNGAMGTITKFIRDRNFQIDGIEVAFDNGTERRIDKAMVNYKHGGAIEIERHQFPLTLAYAITIHKSQGLSLDCVVTDLGTDIFASGMAYVTLSRVKTLAGLYLFAFNKDMVWCDLNSVKEYNRLRKKYEPELPELQCKPKPKRPFTITVTKDMLDGDAPAAKKAKLDNQTGPKEKPQSNAPFLRLRNMDSENPNHCFANTALQVLFASKRIRTLLDNPTLHDPALDILRSFHEREKVGDTRPFSVKPLINLVAAKAEELQYDGGNFADGRQHDSLEFITYLLECSPNHLRPLFSIEVQTMAQCHDCQTPAYVMGVENVYWHKMERGREAQGADFTKSVRGEEMIRKRCIHCSIPCAPNCQPGCQHKGADNNRHQKKWAKIHPTGSAQHMLLQLTMFERIRRNGQNVFVECKGWLTKFTANGIKLNGQKWRADAAGLRNGHTPYAGHYWALTRNDAGGWLLKNDLKCTDQKNFVTNMKNVYYVLFTKV